MKRFALLICLSALLVNYTWAAPTVTPGAGTDDISAIKTALQIMDDWDESDRAKVNPIAGQAGVQGGAGAVTALTQRTTEATKTVLYVSGTYAANGNNEIIAAPAAGTGIRLISYRVENETAVSTTALLTAGNGGAQIDGRILSGLNYWYGDNFSTGRELPIANATALVLNLSGANSHRVHAVYFVE